MRQKRISRLYVIAVYTNYVSVLPHTHGNRSQEIAKVNDVDVNLLLTHVVKFLRTLQLAVNGQLIYT